MFRYRTVLQEAKRLRLLPSAEARRRLLEIAHRESVLRAVRVSAYMESPFLIEALRNDLVQEHSKLLEEGKIEHNF